MRLPTILLIVFSVLLGAAIGHAQSNLVTLNWGVSPTFLVANCQGSSINTSFCSTGDGKIYTEPANSTTWTCIAGCVPVAAGVTSWNGQTGVVTYTPPAPPVTSVNGKTGAVVLGATTTVTVGVPPMSITGGAMTVGAPTATGSTTVQ